MVEKGQHQQHIQHAVEGADDAITRLQKSQQAVLKAKATASPQDIKKSEDQLDSAMTNLQKVQTNLDFQANKSQEQQVQYIQQQLIQAEEDALDTQQIEASPLQNKKR
ncbi:hypothetical protein [Chengkuizengella axinellae]|uniref:Uncharacterized protein n=1 Tax=Chengkuizengella axinellae TaxID=3064388 RepID=A0ABT9J1V6_9BACL|nr:hypothetical protein [Chengkuizengella sp. 2205SS18-9]MDP5275589.1 hypothetical protein [Chengkuizengella sp. 2205SS18-9]